MDGFTAGCVNRKPVAGVHFGDTGLTPRQLDPGIGVAVARRTIFRPGDAECFGRVADRVSAGNMALLGQDSTEPRNRPKAGGWTPSGGHKGTF